MTRATLAVLTVLACATAAEAQQAPLSVRAPGSTGVSLPLRAFGDAGVEMFHALEAFDAVFDRNTAARFGGGVTLLLPRDFFADVRVSRLQMTGERAFAFDGQSYSLGIRDTLTVVPVQITGGLRFPIRASRAVPYLGAGAGWYRARETSDFADADETGARTTLGLHIVGGADVRLWRLAGVGAEIEWSQVSDGLAGTGIATALSDTSLGGVSARVRFLVGAW